MCVCVCAVSYTHLDVYKRQPLDKPISALFGIWFSGDEHQFRLAVDKVEAPITK